MIGCLISVLIFAIVVLIVMYVIVAIVSTFTPVPANILKLVYLLAGLIVLLYALDCIGFLGGPAGHAFRFGRPCP